MSEIPERGPEEPILAWRKWRVSAVDHLLRSIFKDTVWIPREKIEAKCLKGSGSSVVLAGRICSICPGPKCHCGINAVKTRADVHRFGITARPPRLDSDADVTFTVIGLVSLWGRWWEHEAGWRAQYAYPYELQVVMPVSTGMRPQRQEAQVLAAGLRENYLVDVGVF